MSKKAFPTVKALPTSRRRFMQGAVASVAVVGAPGAIGVTAAAVSASSQSAASPSTSATAAVGPAAHPGYTFLRPAEADFIEALVDHMVPADTLTPRGTDLGINVYFDRALGGNWGSGDRLFLEGPWQPGTPSQGYQLPLTPAELFRAGTEAFDAHCRAHLGGPFSSLAASDKESVLLALASGKLALPDCPDTHHYFALLYQCVTEGLFADPSYGGNADKAGWKMLGFPGVIATHAEDVVRFYNRRYEAPILGIADAS